RPSRSLQVVWSHMVDNTSYNSFWNYYGLPTHAITFTPVDGTNNSPGFLKEASLDIEYSGAMAPGAILHGYNGADSYLATLSDIYNRIVTDNTSDVITTSLGLCEALTPSGVVRAQEQFFMQAAAQG